MSRVVALPVVAKTEFIGYRFYSRCGTVPYVPVLALDSIELNSFYSVPCRCPGEHFNPCANRFYGVPYGNNAFKMPTLS